MLFFDLFICYAKYVNKEHGHRYRTKFGITCLHAGGTVVGLILVVVQLK